MIRKRSFYPLLIVVASDRIIGTIKRTVSMFLNYDIFILIVNFLLCKIVNDMYKTSTGKLAKI